MSHVRLARVVLMAQVHSFLPVHESQTMEALNCVGGHPPLCCDVVLGLLGHVLKELQKAFLLTIAGKSILYQIWPAICLLNVCIQLCMCMLW